MQYKTCCIDKLWDKNANQTLDEYLSMFVGESKKEQKILKCEPVIKTGYNTVERTDALWMVTDCPSTAPENLTGLCRNMD
jgi:hypothetical protein